MSEGVCGLILRMTDQKHLRSHSLSLSHTSKHMRTQAHSNLSLPHPHCLPHIHIHTLIHTHTLTLTRRHLRLTLTRVFWRCKLQTLKSIFTRECLDDPATPTAPAQHRTRPPPTHTARQHTRETEDCATKSVLPCCSFTKVCDTQGQSRNTTFVY
jgi:hypothetical protein